MKTIDELKRENEQPVIIADQEGFVVYINEKFTQTFGWSSNEILAQRLETIIPDNYNNSHHLGFSRFILTENSTILNHPLVLMAVNQKGQEIESEHFITAEKINGQWFFGAILRPLS